MSVDHKTTKKEEFLAASAIAKANEELRSQEEVRKRYAAILREERNIHFKSQSAYVRRAVKGEKILTVIDGIKETENTVKDDNSWVVCGKHYGELYVLTYMEFRDSYDLNSVKPIKIEEEKEESEHSLFLKRLKEDGFQEYQSKRSVYAHEVSDKDISWFNNGTCTHHVAHFMAPWGEADRVEVGDLLVMAYPSSGDDVYRIERNVFGQTYKPRQV